MLACCAHKDFTEGDIVRVEAFQFDENTYLSALYSADEVERRLHQYGLADLQEFIRKVEFVSLGSYCLPTMSMKLLGLRKSAYPLDYARSSARGIIELYSTGFADFLTGTPVLSPEHGVSVQNTAWGGSFWHHDIYDTEVYNSMIRRVDRLLGHKRKPRILCRSVNSTSELALSLELLSVLQSAYSGPVRLLIMIENQHADGPIGLCSSTDVLFYRIHSQYTFASGHEVRMNGFLDPLATAIHLWAGEPVHMAQVSTLSQVMDMCDSIEGGNPANALFAANMIAPARLPCPPETIREVPSMIAASGAVQFVPKFSVGAEQDEEHTDWLSLSISLRSLVQSWTRSVDAYTNLSGSSPWPSAELAWQQAGFEPC
eukprot:6438429-Amphidinium_carterae.1